MSKPFIVCQEAVPIRVNRSRARRRRDLISSPNVFEFGPDEELNSVTAKSTQDALHAAEAYFQEVRRSSFRQFESARHSPRTTLLDLLVDDDEEPADSFGASQRRESIAGLGTSQRRESIYFKGPQGGNPEWPSALKSSIYSPGEGFIGLESPTELSLDCAYANTPHPPMFSSPVESSPGERRRRISIAQADMDEETPSEFSLEDSDTGEHGSMFSSPATPSSDTVRRKMVRRRSPGNAHRGAKCSPLVQDGGSFKIRGKSSPQDSVQSADEFEDFGMQTKHPDDASDLTSKSTFEWNEVFRRSSVARSRESPSDGSFITGRSGMSSTSSRASLSDEAISERAAAWGDGVASLVIKNSSHESTPRTSDGSSEDRLHCGQNDPGVSKHVKDVLSSFQLAFVVCDVIDRQNSILFASEGFFGMTGYSPEEVIGRNCRFLQGVDTDANEVSRIRMAVQKGEAYSGTILNYKKNGSPFWNLLSLSPISDDKGVVIKYMGMQAEVSKSVAARRKKTALETSSKDVPRSICKPISEASPVERSSREVDKPIFTLSSTTGLTAKADRYARSPENSKRYSLTYGIQGSKRYSLTPGSRGNRRHSIATPERLPSMEPRLAEKTIGGSERYTLPAGKKPSLGPKRRPSKTSSAARPLYWLLTAVRVLEDEIGRLGCDPDLMIERPGELNPEESKVAGKNFQVAVKSRSRINRMARGVLGFFRKVESKVWRRERARGSSNRVTAYDSESEMDFGDLPEVGTRSNYFSQDLHCDSMPQINPTRAGNLSIAALQADLRARSNRNFSVAMPERFGKKISSSNTNEFVLDRKQFCIVHD